jgi:sarcosine oxidase
MSERAGREGALAVDVDVAIVGLGGIGSAAAYFAARRGLRVLGLERFDLGGHRRGASHDHSRIIRRSYHTEYYVQLTAAAYAAWREVEMTSGQRCIWTTGGVDLFPPDAAISVSTYVDAMTAAGVPFEVLDAAAVRRRWPVMTVDDGVTALYQADAGIVSPDRAVPLLQKLASARGADLRGRACVSGVEPLEGAVLVRLEHNERPIRARTVVLAADAWTNDVLAPLGRALPLTVLQEQITYYEVADPGPFAVGAFPLWIWMDDPSFYGFPVFGRDGLKLAQDCGGRTVEAASRSFDADPAILARTTDFGRRVLGARLGPPLHTATCLYTLTPDRDFVLDQIPGCPNVLVALGAAHGFKFVPWFGRTLAALVAGEPPDDDLSPFAFDRPALREPATVANWLV